MGGGAVRLLRRIAAVLGAVLILIAFFAGRLGLSVGSGFSGNQMILTAVGLVLIVAAILGRSFPRFYRGAALLFLNVIVLLVLLELASIALVKIMDRERFAMMARKRAEAGEVTREWSVIVSEYVPWVLWRSTPSYPGDPVGVDRYGYRITPGASRSDDAFRVFTFGGSAMWGSGVDDSSTIPACLQRDLEDAVEGSVCVSNMGQNAFTTTQAWLISLGAVLFWVSDLMLAINRFRKPLRKEPFGLFLYYGGQLMIALSPSYFLS